MYCSRCKSENVDSATFCVKCGKLLLERINIDTNAAGAKKRFAGGAATETQAPAQVKNISIENESIDGMIAEYKEAIHRKLESEWETAAPSGSRTIEQAKKEIDDMLVAYRKEITQKQDVKIPEKENVDHENIISEISDKKTEKIIESIVIPEINSDVEDKKKENDTAEARIGLKLSEASESQIDSIISEIVDKKAVLAKFRNRKSQKNIINKISTSLPVMLTVVALVFMFFYGIKVLYESRSMLMAKAASSQNNAAANINTNESGLFFPENFTADKIILYGENNHRIDKTPSELSLIGKYRMAKVKPGKYLLVLVKENCETIKMPIVVKQDMPTVLDAKDIMLKEIQAKVTVQTNVDAEILIEAIPKAGSEKVRISSKGKVRTLTANNVPPGVYKISAKSDDGKRASSEIKVEKGETRIVKLNLK